MTPVPSIASAPVGGWKSGMRSWVLNAQVPQIRLRPHRSDPTAAHLRELAAALACSGVVSACSTAANVRQARATQRDADVDDERDRRGVAPAEWSAAPRDHRVDAGTILVVRVRRRRRSAAGERSRDGHRSQRAGFPGRRARIGTGKICQLTRCAHHMPQRPDGSQNPSPARVGAKCCRLHVTL